MTKRVPNMTKPMPNMTKLVPNMTKHLSNMTKRLSNMTKDQPNMTKRVSNITKRLPNMTKRLPNITQRVLNMTERLPNMIKLAGRKLTRELRVPLVAGFLRSQASSDRLRIRRVLRSFPSRPTDSAGWLILRYIVVFPPRLSRANSP
jgi:hypothetical protein